MTGKKLLLSASMGESTEWMDAAYDQAYQDELNGLARRKELDSSCTVRDLEGILQNLYILQGNDQCGRGPVQDIALSATIAAYEHFIEELKKEHA